MRLKNRNLQLPESNIEIGGRKWAAWFTPDVPLNFGPYKFQGLPGLIVSVSDAKSHYSFMLQGNKRKGTLLPIGHTAGN